MPKAKVTTRSTAAKSLHLNVDSSEDSEDSQYNSESDCEQDIDAVLDGSEDSSPDWEPEKEQSSSKRQRLFFSTSTPTPAGSGGAAATTPTAIGAQARGRGRSPRASGSHHVPHLPERQWQTVEDEDVEPPPLTFKPLRKPGPQQATRFAKTPLDFFKLFFTDAVLKCLVANTNAYGHQKQQGKKEAWRNIKVTDFLSYMSIVVYMGLVKCMGIVDYWNGSRFYGLPFPGSVISRNKFLIICRALHMSSLTADAQNDAKRGTPDYDRLSKIKPLYQSIVSACKAHFQPEQNISIDERMVASRARTRLKQYIRNKPTKCGYKLLILTDSESGYNWNLSVFEGKSAGSRKGHSYDSVMSLMDFDNLGTGYHLYVDNFYTSSHLFHDLLAKQIGACGTVRPDQNGFPRTHANDFTRGTPRGTIRWMRDGSLLLVKWMDTQQVAICSTIHKAYSGHTAKRRVKTGGEWKETDVPIPAAIKDYNQHMGGVDLSDALIGYHSVIHKTKKWYRAFFYHFVDVAVVNAYILYQQRKRSPPLTQKEFRQALVEELAGKGSVSTYQRPVSRYIAPPAPEASHKLHYFTEGQKVAKKDAGSAGRRKCVRCHKKTPVGCKSCNVALCFVATRDCYNEWHTLKGL